MRSDGKISLTFFSIYLKSLKLFLTFIWLKSENSTIQVTLEHIVWNISKFYFDLYLLKIRTLGAEICAKVLFYGHLRRLPTPPTFIQPMICKGANLYAKTTTLCSLKVLVFYSVKYNWNYIEFLSFCIKYKLKIIETA